MPSYKLSYFDVRGRGELSRYLFLAAGRDFKEHRIPRAEWPNVKQTLVYGQVPVLEVDGKQLAQSNAIARFLAREFGLAGKNSWEEALCDQTLELISDLRQEFVKYFFEKDEEKKKEAGKNLNDVVYPKFFGYFEKQLDNNGGKYLVGSELTVADLAVYAVIDTAVQNTENLLDKHVKLRAHRDMVGAIPKIQEYVSNRKKTDI
ncbi:probable glutathione S-transferase 7 [Dreissena polymorpha]|uniref:Glutathione S-transferase n=1 Tax=Dreissena polymorpha TaxID=45954 RepID=A0A9D4ED59_DREPO|nr:probable glutathione S-transferase 7 [Dreissena polymorpha]XP_052231031.1 probable glutathione S-transferase 7 [Dreissena polymorpha]XP_052231032.1 probable glutathione S-transferase 7 [Dreissena polymorpha]XP_052231033.1 probable glutathione S-transferase 7 [Dreissena polymorpha]XP_052231034.1 probable glutathione S-transferase 7 [Dreissena polymorpha]XP_052231035.1 probable glutathione S-transferase 7 [Dreissena polymorpha]XP_052231036.1 probable glutathione S-transferase 7 [Dreissena po